MLLEVLKSEKRGVSTIAATIVLIAMVMVLGGILSAGIVGTTPENPRESGIIIRGATPNSDRITLLMQAGKTYLRSYSLADNEISAPTPESNADIKWSQLELRIAGERVEADVQKATVEGEVVPLDNNTGDNTKWDIKRNVKNLYQTDSLDFHLGDIIRLENIDPTPQDGDIVAIVWNPGDQVIYSEEV